MNFKNKSYGLRILVGGMIVLILLRLAFDAPETGLADGLQTMIQDRIESSFNQIFKLEGQESLNVDSIQWK